jgi:hypothetical protein
MACTVGVTCASGRGVADGSLRSAGCVGCKASATNAATTNTTHSPIEIGRTQLSSIGSSLSSRIRARWAATAASTAARGP